MHNHKRSIVRRQIRANDTSGRLSERRVLHGEHDENGEEPEDAYLQLCEIIYAVLRVQCTSTVPFIELKTLLHLFIRTAERVRQSLIMNAKRLK